MSSDTRSEHGSESGRSQAPRPPQEVNRGADSAPIPSGTTQHPLTIAQTSIVLDAIYLPNSPVANTGDIAHINGHLYPELFAAACRQIVAETASIRASFGYREGSLVQEFVELDDYALEQHDFSASEQPELSAQAWIEEHFWTTLPWNSFPLFQFALLKLRDDRFLFFQKFHHGLSDAIGRFQCFGRIACVYEALVQGLPTAPPEMLSITSRIAEEAAYLSSDAYEADIVYWKIRLNEFPDPLVDADRNKTERARSGRPQRITYDIAAEDFANLKKATTALGASVPRMALAFAYIAVSRLYGASDVVIGCPLHNRSTELSKRSVDLSMTVMPFRMDFEGGLTIAKFVKKIAAMLLADRRHSKCPFSSLGRLTGRHEAGRPLFDIVVNYIPAMGEISLGGTEVTYNNYSAGFFSPWAIDIRETHNGLGAKLTVTFDPGLIETEDGARLAKCLHFLLTNSIDLADQTIGTIPIINEEERHHLLFELNDNDVPLPDDATLTSLCARQAERTPDAIAVTHGTQSITYAELHRRADMVASHLLESGVCPEVVVGVALPRSIELIVALLAIHKAGGAYLPLDPALPAERLAYMASDAQARFIVTIRALVEQLPETSARRIFLDDPVLTGSPSTRVLPPEHIAPRPENLAYVIYTSGSTGFPKGVAVEHRSVANFVLHQASQLEPSDLVGFLFSTALSFDVSIDEVFVSLTAGGRLIIVENLLALPASSGNGEVTILGAAPSVFDALLQIGGFPAGVRLIRFGGEALPRSLVERVFAIDPNVRIMNLYGPTEATVWATVSHIYPADCDEPPIGKGLWNIKLYVLDKNMEPLPKGAKGELYIGGVAVARGYLNKPELTAARFVKSPFGVGNLYRTGDIVRWRKDDELEFFGRVDTQVKINGLRIELGEIERQLETMPEIASAVAIVQPDVHGVRRIFAFAIPRDTRKRPDLSTLNDYFEGKLPKYMIPVALTWIDNFPLTSSGKLDRKALSLPAWNGLERSYRAPSTNREAFLASLWSEVLKIPKIGIDDDFFELGGTSLQAVMIFARIAYATGLDLPAVTLANAPTIARLAELLRHTSRQNAEQKLFAFRKSGVGAPLFFVHSAGGTVMYVRELMKEFRNKNPLYGLQPAPLDGRERIPRSIKEIAAAYVAEIRKVQTAGPYHIFGYCAGGTIAYEIAQQLNHAGETVAVLGLIEERLRSFDKRAAARARMYRFGVNQSSIIRYVPKRFVRTIITRIATAQNASKKIWQAAKRIPNVLRYSLRMAIPRNDWVDFYAPLFNIPARVYSPKPYSGTITVFAIKMNLEVYKAMWSTLATGRVIARELPGEDHAEVMQPPNSRFLAMQIDSCLNELRSSVLPINAGLRRRK